MENKLFPAIKIFLEQGCPQVENQKAKQLLRRQPDLPPAVVPSFKLGWVA
jgi:hypothetical protein